MTIAYEILGFYGALAVWGGLLIYGLTGRRYWPFIIWGLVLLVFLNVGYFVRGQPDAIAYFVGIYDVFDNLGLGRTEGAPALAQCADNACTVWGDRYVNHPSWGVAFHDRFLNGPQLRTNLLYVHIALNSIAFLLLHYQLWRPGVGDQKARHRLIGRISFAAVTGGTFCAVWLASEHGSVSEYGGILAELGFYSMALVVYSCAVMGVATVRRGDLAGHRKWMFRYAGSMWGAFWLFRVMLVVTGPALRSFESVSLLLSIWLSAPLGVLIAEWIRQRSLVIGPSSPIRAGAKL